MRLALTVVSLVFAAIVPISHSYGQATPAPTPTRVATATPSTPLATPTPAVRQRNCNPRLAANVVAAALADKIRSAFNKQVSERKISRLAVRVASTVPRVASLRKAIDFASGITATGEVTATGASVTVSGALDLSTVYQQCSPGKTTFRVTVSYMDNSRTPAAFVTSRQTIEIELPGLYL